jgi:predicted Zn-dependent peptidase
MGKNTDPMIPLAFNYLKYIGTDEYSAAELQQELFKNALNFSVNAGNKRSYLTIRGLKESMPVAMDLMEHILHHAKADQESYNAYIDGILKKRADAKMNMNTILWNGLFTYARYGADNPFNNVIPEEELKAVDPATLTQLVSDISNFEHNVFYYGPETPRI